MRTLGAALTAQREQMQTQQQNPTPFFTPPPTANQPPIPQDDQNRKFAVFGLPKQFNNMEARNLKPRLAVDKNTSANAISLLYSADLSAADLEHSGLSKANTPKDVAVGGGHKPTMDLRHINQQQRESAAQYNQTEYQSQGTPAHLMAPKGHNLDLG